MRVLASAVLVFEAIVIGLAIPVAITVSDVSGARAGSVGGLLAVTCLVAAGLLRSRAGYVLGSVVQVALLLCGLVVPAVFAVGLLFGGLWALALWLGAKGERVAAARRSSG